MADVVLSGIGLFFCFVLYLFFFVFWRHPGSTILPTLCSSRSLFGSCEYVWLLYGAVCGCVSGCLGL